MSYSSSSSMKTHSRIQTIWFDVVALCRIGIYTYMTGAITFYIIRTTCMYNISDRRTRWNIFIQRIHIEFISSSNITTGQQNDYAFRRKRTRLSTLCMMGERVCVCQHMDTKNVYYKIEYVSVENAWTPEPDDDDDGAVDAGHACDAALLLHS